MDLVTVRELYKNRDAYLGKEISIGGWVRSIRDSKAFGFIVVSDGTFFETLQVVYHDTHKITFAAQQKNVYSFLQVYSTLQLPGFLMNY